MSNAFDELQRSGFAGIGFAVTRWSVKGGLRHHPHEYPGSPGGQVEGLGRKLYQIEFDALFSTNDPAYEGAFPDNLNTIRTLFENGEVGPIIVPHLGTLQGKAIDWDEQADPTRMRDGVRMKMVFTEDSEEDSGVDELVTTTHVTAQAELLIESIPPLEEREPDLFESLEGLANEAVGLMDQAELMGDMAGAKLEGIVSKANQIDQKFSALADPENHGIGRALRDLAVAVIVKIEQLGREFGPHGTYTTPRLMAVTEVSVAVYGDTSHAVDILKANPIEDAFAIPEGTELKV